MLRSVSRTTSSGSSTDLGRQARRVAFDAATAPAHLTQAIERAGGKAELKPDPITLMKAVKNPVELAGARAAHERDGAAMARFLAWFAGEAPRGRPDRNRRRQGVGDVSARKPARSRTSPFRPSPARDRIRPSLTIGSAKPPTARSSAGIFLIDSGAQYEDGTTDITRTIAVGRPTSLMRDRFTRVLKGHIAVARAVFPPGTTGAQIDALARMALWRAGLDFDHGTGHGVGSYLSVHEGPQRLAKTGTTALAPGMIVSNEPGYYAAGAFGIRIENLVAVETRTIAGGERPMLGFETLTLAPIDLALVEPKLLDADEIAWLDAYHARVRKTLWRPSSTPRPAAGLRRRRGGSRRVSAGPWLRSEQVGRYREPNRRFAASVTGVYRLTSVPSGSRNCAARFPHGIVFGSCTTVAAPFSRANSASTSST